jgi:hypothetical protein
VTKNLNTWEELRVPELRGAGDLIVTNIDAHPHDLKKEIYKRLSEN